MSTENVDLIEPEQSRGGRALLDMTQPQLAKASGLSLSTIVDFERSRRPVSRQAIQAIRKALEQSGIEFIDDNGGGPGARLQKRRRHPKKSK